MIRTANQALLARYFNTGQIHRSDLITGLLSPSLLFKKNAGAATELHRQPIAGSTDGNIEHYSIPQYKGNQEVVLKMAGFLQSNLSGSLAGAYVHGSLATEDAVSYSDFDGLLIIKDEVFDDTGLLAKTAELISRSFSIMIDFDPLQHHGWFIVTEKDLTNFPNHYFPAVLFEYAASLLEHGNQIKIKTGTAPNNYPAQLKRLSASVIRKIDNRGGFRNMFTLKALLSEFMLMPSLLVESKTGKGVYKKFSFPLAKEYFTADQWAVMDEVSAIRASWQYTPAWTIGKTPVLVTPYIRKIQAAKAGPIPNDLAEQLTPIFIARMRNLAALFSDKSE